MLSTHGESENPTPSTTEEIGIEAHMERECLSAKPDLRNGPKHSL